MEMNVDAVARDIRRYLYFHDIPVTEDSVRNCLKDTVTDLEFRKIFKRIKEID